MINHVSLNGVLLERESNSPIRYIEVTLQYKDDLGVYPKDIFPLMMWSRDDRNSLFSYSEALSVVGKTVFNAEVADIQSLIRLIGIFVNRSLPRQGGERMSAKYL